MIDLFILRYDRLKNIKQKLSLIWDFASENMGDNFSEFENLCLQLMQFFYGRSQMTNIDKSELNAVIKVTESLYKHPSTSEEFKAYRRKFLRYYKSSERKLNRKRKFRAVEKKNVQQERIWEEILRRSVKKEDIKYNSIYILPRVKGYFDEKIIVNRGNLYTDSERNLFYVHTGLANGFYVQDVHAIDNKIRNMYLDQGIIPISILKPIDWNHPLVDQLKTKVGLDLTDWEDDELLNTLRSMDGSYSHTYTAKTTTNEMVILLKEELSKRKNFKK